MSLYEDKIELFFVGLYTLSRRMRLAAIKTFYNSFNSLVVFTLCAASYFNSV